MHYGFIWLSSWILPQSADRTPTPHLLEEKTISRSPTSHPQPPISKLPEHATERHQAALSDHLLLRCYSWEVPDKFYLGLLLDEEAISNFHLETLGVWRLPCKINHHLILGYQQRRFTEWPDFRSSVPMLRMSSFEGRQHEPAETSGLGVQRHDECGSSTDFLTFSKLLSCFKFQFSHL